MYFGIGVQLFCYLFWAFNVFGGLIQYPLGNAADINNLNNMFSINLWTALVGGAGVVISIAALLLRQGTYALYALLLFAIGVFFNVVKGFVLVVPNTIAALLPASTNPLGTGTNPIAVVVGVIVLIAGFMYVFGLVIQREP